jgi:hypothetical protein
MTPDNRPEIVVSATAMSLRIESDEDGMHLLIEDEDGERYDFNIQAVAYEFAASQGLRGLLDWHAEGEIVRREHATGVLYRPLQPGSLKRTVYTDPQYTNPPQIQSNPYSWRHASCSDGRHDECQEAFCECDCHSLDPGDPKHPTYAERMRGLADRDD